MQRLARIIPIVVAVFVILVATMLVTKSRTAHVESAAPDPARADLRMKEVEIEEQSGNVRWRLKADQALVFQEEARTALRNVDVVVHDKEREWTIRADEGEVVEKVPKVRNVEMRHNVVVTTNDGMRLETTVLHWNGADKRLWTDAPVRIVRGQSVVNGTGFELRTADEVATVTGRLRATFAEEARR
jgi:LPS export ABC transporter protein LptC